MIKQKKQSWIWKVIPLNKNNTKELWEGYRQDGEKILKEKWLCKEKEKGLWECKVIKETITKVTKHRTKK